MPPQPRGEAQSFAASGSAACWARRARMPPKSMDSSGSCHYLAAVWNAFWNEVLLSRGQANTLPMNDQCVTTFYDDHVLIIFMYMFGRSGCFSAGPERHLAPVGTVVHVAFHSRRCLGGSRYPICGIFHERGEITHACVSYGAQRRIKPRRHQGNRKRCDVPGVGLNK